MCGAGTDVAPSPVGALVGVIVQALNNVTGTDNNNNMTPRSLMV